jgi:GGDEF domain-containing protein
VEAKDPFLRGHSEEVSGYVAAVADQLGIEPGRREQLVFGSLLHDVGKIGISERILLKPAALTPQERSVIQLHPRIGYRLVDQVPALRPIAPAILYHHERFDGGGYPAGLRGDEIPPEARIIAVADSYSAMTSDRPYHMARSPEEACGELERGAGTQFDPEVVRLFVEEVRRGSADKAEVLAHALDDPELEVRRRGGEPILGHGALAVIDNLTLLYSRRHLQEAAHAEAERAGVQQRPFALVLVELAELAALNAREGYAAGDAAIQAVAERLQHVAVRRGATACRYSGGRLALLAPATDEAAGEDLLGELEAELGEGPSVRTSLAVWQPGESGADTVIRARRGLEPEVAAAPSASPTSS